MKQLFATLAVAALLASCGGGGSPSNAAPTPPPAPVAVADTADHYIPAFFMHAAHGVVVLRADPTQVAAEFTSGPGWDSWGGNGKEFSSAKVCAGDTYVYAEGFGDDSGNMLALEAVIDRVTGVNGVTVDLAQLCPGRAPSYLPWNLPATGTITHEQYFWIHNNDGSRNRPGYWKATYRLGEFRLNPCWQGTGSNNRPVLVQLEVWWDSAKGWVRGHPNQSGSLPWSADGSPLAIDVTPEQENDFGRDAGPLWTGKDAGIELCLRNS